MKILILKTSALGDVIHTFPVVDYLKKRFPVGQIDWVVETRAASLVKAHPHIDRVLSLDSKRWREKPFSSSNRKERSGFRTELKKVHYDLVFDLQGNLKSSWVLSQVVAKKKIGFGWKTVPEWPNALFTSHRFNPHPNQNIREDYLSVVQSYFRDPQSFVSSPIALTLTEEERCKLVQLKLNPTLVCPGAAWPNKRLPQKTLSFVLKKINRGPYMFSWGSNEEREIAMQLSAEFPNSYVLEPLSLPLLQHVMAKCQLVIAMDSLPLHLCGTTQTASLSFFGPSSASKYLPMGKQHRAFQGLCPYGIRFEKRCSRLRSCPTGACLSENQWIETTL
ncbi:MAG: glycosyltransferase family 9 protein [Chlamydiales bacterium]